MRRGEAAQALASWRAFAFGLASILFVTPVVGKLVLMSGLRPMEFCYGLAVFCCMPTSLSANIALSGAVGANTAMSILLTASSNVLAVFTMPLVLSSILATSGAVSFEPLAMIRSLVQTVLIPLCMGVCLRAVTQVRSFVDGNKKLVRNVATTCLVTVPYTQIGMARQNGYLEGLTPDALLALAGCTLAALCCMRAFNLMACEWLGFGASQEQPETIKRAVVLAASQKTLPISIAVLMQLTPIIGPGVGLATLPCVLAHFAQVVLDSFLVSWWQKQDAAAGRA